VRAARRTLGGLLEVAPAEAGMHLVGWLPDGLDDRVAARAGLTRDVDAVPLSAFRVRPAKPGEPGGLILGYAAYAPGRSTMRARAWRGPCEARLDGRTDPVGPR
jgi:DNA-binding transcriptional MocR family regulator